MKPQKTILTCLFLLFALLPVSDLAAELKLHPLFTNHAVLQQGLPVPIWGTATPGEKVTVSFNDQTVNVITDTNRKWMLKLKPLKASSKGSELIVKSGDESITITDVLIGEVWVCSGQSNMAFTVANSTDATMVQTEARKGQFKKIRLFKVPVKGSTVRQATVKATWVEASAGNVRRFSATGFYFGRALHRDKNVPVGLIQAANGGTNAYSWINSDTLKNDKAAVTIREFWKTQLKRAPAAMEIFEKRKKAWLDKGKKGRSPRMPMNAGHPKRPAGHYNAMIAPLQPFAIQGAIWYQGEANSRHPFAPGYRDLMFALVDDWRTDWHAATKAEGKPRKFPFYLVQLPNFKRPDEGWSLIREQMLKFWQDGEKTGMVVTIDVGNPTDIHPKNKLPVGERLARFARAETYGEEIVFSGPIYKSMQAKEGKIILQFDHTGDGLKSLDSQPLRHFEIAGEDGSFIPASATIEDKHSIIVSSPKISNPQAVRYAWKPNPEKINFVNNKNLPASPFRTDSTTISLEPVTVSNKPKRKQRKRNPAFAEIKDVKGLPRILLIGDSISIGYTLEVRKFLKGKANVHRANANCGPTDSSLKRIDKWLEGGRWDIIHFNWGLHDVVLLQLKKTKSRTDDTWRCTETLSR